MSYDIELVAVIKSLSLSSGPALKKIVGHKPQPVERISLREFNTELCLTQGRANSTWAHVSF